MTIGANSVKLRRLALNLGASELARRAGMTRQALHRLETAGLEANLETSYTPSVTVALQLARVLKCRVEDLFRLPEMLHTAELVGKPLAEQAEVHQRLQLAYVDSKLCAYPLLGSEALSESADALLAQTLPTGQVLVQPLTPPTTWQAAVLCGCDPALSLLRRHTLGQYGGRVLLRSMVSQDALSALVSGQAHAAGLHLYDPVSQQSNLPFVVAALPQQVVHIYALWSWEQGLIVQLGNPLWLHTVPDLGRAGLRLINRPVGAGSRQLLDTWLAAAGLDAAELLGYSDTAATPLELAEAVAHARADVGVGPRSAAQAYKLGFVPLLRERFDLVIPDSHLNHPSVQAVLQAARSATMQRELTALGGYDPTQAGQLITTLYPQRSA